MNLEDNSNNQENSKKNDIISIVAINQEGQKKSIECQILEPGSKLLSNICSAFGYENHKDFGLVLCDEKKNTLNPIKLSKALIKQNISDGCQIEICRKNKVYNFGRKKAFKRTPLSIQKKNSIPEIPQLIKDCFENLEFRGLNEEGLFRVPGNIKSVISIKKKYEMGKTMELNRFDIHIVAGVIKMFFRDLPEPVLTFELYEPLLEAIKLETEDLKIEGLKQCLESLPSQNKVLLQYLLEFLIKMLAYEKENKMTVENLSVVWQPSLLRPEIETIDTFLTDSSLAREIIQKLITHYEILFLNPTNGKEMKPEMTTGFRKSIYMAKTKLQISSVVGKPETVQQKTSSKIVRLVNFLLEGDIAAFEEYLDELPNKDEREEVLHGVVELFEAKMLEKGVKLSNISNLYERKQLRQSVLLNALIDENMFSLELNMKKLYPGITEYEKVKSELVQLKTSIENKPQKPIESSQHKSNSIESIRVSKELINRLKPNFDKVQRKGFITPKQLFLMYNVGRRHFGEIWRLADYNKDGVLDFEEFIIADILINFFQSGNALPKTLPFHLIPSRYKWHITDEQKEKYSVLFEKFDNDKDGLLSIKQAGEVFSHLGIGKTDVTKIWNLSDFNRDKALNKDEFIIAQFLVEAKLKGEEIPETLPKTLVPDNYRWSIPKKKKKEYKQMFEKEDYNNDGKISATQVLPLLGAQSISINDLASIWRLVEVNEIEQTFDFEQFAISKFLVEQKINGEEIPEELPSTLKLSSKDEDKEKSVPENKTNPVSQNKLSQNRSNTFSVSYQKLSFNPPPKKEEKKKEISQTKGVDITNSSQAPLNKKGVTSDVNNFKNQLNDQLVANYRPRNFTINSNIPPLPPRSLENNSNNPTQNPLTKGLRDRSASVGGGRWFQTKK